MDDEFPPTELTREDIDRVMKQWEEDLNKPVAMTHCPSCDKHMPLILTDYYTGQCQECFWARKPWLSTSPVRDAYFQVVDGR
jgi:NMD protein affecting ribosome stability and mRNA decay